MIQGRKDNVLNVELKFRLGGFLMSIDVFFTRPGKEEEVTYYLVGDIRYAKKRILLAMAYFSDTKILREIKENPRAEKKFLFNKSDVIRDSEISMGLIRDGYDVVSLGTCQIKSKQEESKIVNSSLMHHKFIIIDDVVWIGSYNFSRNAREKNWENMIRIKDKEVVDRFVQEYYRMFRLGFLPNPTLEGNIGSITGEKPKIYYNSCSQCHNVFNNPLEHYHVNIKTKSAIHSYGYFSIEDGPFGIYFPFVQERQEQQGGTFHIEVTCVEGNNYKEDCSNCGIPHLKHELISIEEEITNINIPTDDYKIWNINEVDYKNYLSYEPTLGIYVEISKEKNTSINHYCTECINEFLRHLKTIKMSKPIYTSLLNN